MNLDQFRIIPPQVVGELKTILISGFTEYADVRIACSKTNSNYLIIPYKFDPNFAILVEISEDRLQIIKGGEMNLIYPFKNPENDLFYLAQFDENEKIKFLTSYKPNEYTFEWPIPANLSIDFKWIEQPKPFNIVEYAQKKGRVAIEFIVEFNDFKDSTIKAASIKKYLIPFNELVKTALLSNAKNLYNEKTIEKVLHIGFSKIEFKCLRSILEFDYNQSPQIQKSTIENITNLYFLLDCDDEKEIENYLKNFENSKIIVQYISILKNVINDKSRISSKVATPAKHQQSFALDRQRSVRLRKTIIKDQDSFFYEENVVGVLTLIEHDPQKKYSHFSLKSIVDDKPYKGRISQELRNRVEELAFTLVGQEYDCKINVTYTPESTTKQENYEYELVEIEPVVKTAVEYPNRDIMPSE